MKPHQSIEKYVNNKLFGFAWHPVFSHNPKRLADLEFKRCLELFIRHFQNNDIPVEDMRMRQQNWLFEADAMCEIIQEMEEPFHKQLEQIAQDIIREIYDVPEQLVIDALIKDPNDMPDEDYLDDQSQEEKIEEFAGLPEAMQERIMKEVKKRIILNAIVTGSSMLIWKSAHYLAKDKIDALDKELFEMYNKYIALISIYSWHQDVELIEDFFDMENPLMNKKGKEELIKEENSIRIKAQAVSFPILLMECNKGIMDYLILHAVPVDFSSDELHFYYALADNFKDEIWHFLLSPTLYADLIEVMATEPSNFPKIIMKLCQAEYSELEKLFIFVQSDKEEAKKLLNKIIR